MKSARQQKLQQWLNESLGTVSIELVPLQNDASLRCFYRINTAPTTVLMDAALDAKNQEFLTATKLLQSHDIQTPKIFCHDLSLGLFQVEDFGDNLLFNYVTDAHIEKFLIKAVDVILKLQTIPTNALVNPQIFDGDFIQRELHLFSEWFISQYVELQLTSDQQLIMDETYRTIQEILLSQPYLSMHRDFHCKNIMVLPDQSLGILDFQDLMIGPVTYDLMSLLKDCYVTWPDSTIEKLLQYFYQSAGQRFAFKNYDDFVFYFDVSGLQRHLKVLGGFSKIYFTRANDFYLQYFDRILAYIVQVTAKYPQFDPFNRILTTVIIPQLFKV